MSESTACVRSYAWLPGFFVICACLLLLVLTILLLRDVCGRGCVAPPSALGQSRQAGRLLPSGVGRALKVARCGWIDRLQLREKLWLLWCIFASLGLFVLLLLLLFFLGTESSVLSPHIPPYVRVCLAGWLSQRRSTTRSPCLPTHRSSLEGKGAVLLAGNTGRGNMDGS